MIYLKDLPKVSAFSINKKINNYQDSYYLRNEQRSESNTVDVLNKINDIFVANNIITRKRVRIILKDDIVERTIIGRTNKYLLTLTGDKINIQDIRDIKIL